jgi:S-DNA-T family DNA segregation ATPase FtsK/SpoIIIE
MASELTGRVGPAPAPPVREFPAPLPDEPVVIAAPPVAPDPEGSRWTSTVLPALSSLGIIGFAVVSGSALYIALGVGLSLIGVGAAVAARAGSNRARRRRRERARERYGKHLDERHEQLTDLAAQQRRALLRVHPDPAGFTDVVARGRLWERRPADPDFLAVRLGLGRVALGVPVQLEPQAPVTEEEDDLREDAELLVAWHTHLDDVPVALDLMACRSLILSGPVRSTRPLLRAMLVSLALAHAPGEVRLATLVDPAETRWLALLPQVVLAASGVGELEGYLETRAEQPSPLLVVVDSAELSGVVGAFDLLDRLVGSADTGVRLVLLDSTEGLAPAAAGAMMTFDGDGCGRLRRADGTPEQIVPRPDALAASAATTAAVAMEAVAPGLPAEGDNARPVLLSRLLVPADDAPPLSVPLGRDARGRPVELDLAESAFGGAGPHGLIVGATGSGKSELLRTMIAGLVTRRRPDEVALVCWDFKGGAAVSPFSGLPHLRGTVTNLESEPRLIDRAGRSLRAEIRRRQRLLRDADVDDINAYCHLPANQASSPAVALPTLVLLVDEFTELLAAAPDLLDLFLTVGRLGRSLGIHLVLASQRLDEGRLRGLESHLRFRICLRTFSAADSHAVLGTAAAFHLPAAPGSGLLSVDGGVTRFDGAFPDDLPQLVESAERHHRDVAVPCHGVWLPALQADLGFDALPPAVPSEPLRVAVGVVDRPDEQRQDPLVADLTSAHLAVVGGPRSGRSTTVRTLICALAAVTPPEDVQVYAIDASDSLSGIEGLPHVGAVCPLEDEERIRQLLGELLRLVRRRGRTSAVVSGSSAGSPSGLAQRDGYGEVVLVIDGWFRFREVYDDLPGAVADLAATGPAAGLRLVLTSGGWSDFRTGLREHLTNRWEHRLTDPYESEHGKARASALPRDQPGRLLTMDGEEAQVALPRESGGDHAALIGAIAARGGRPAPPLRLLPDRISLADLPRHPGEIVLGASTDEPARVPLDLLGADGHLLVVGDAGSGRSTVLATLLTQLPARDVDVWILDPRRGLLARSDAAAEYAYTGSGGTRLIERLASLLRPRLPADGLTPAELRDLVPNAWRAQVLVVDDYEVLSSSGLGGFAGSAALGGVLGPLADLLPHAREIGLSLVVARRGGAAVRAGFDPAWQGLIDLAPPALLLSGDPSDGPVMSGVRARPMPPGRGLLVRRTGTPVLVQVAAPAPVRELSRAVPGLRTA